MPQAGYPNPTGQSMSSKPDLSAIFYFHHQQENKVFIKRSRATKKTLQVDTQQQVQDKWLVNVQTFVNTSLPIIFVRPVK